MPLLDHFRPPLSPQRHWQSFHSAWPGSIADLLNEDLLPPNYFAEETTQVGTRVEIDVATFEEKESVSTTDTNGPVGVSTKVWTPTKPTGSTPITFSDTFQVQVFATEGGSRLVAAVELISPSNKDRPQTRHGFAVKCANYLYHGISVVVVDIVTSRHANLHKDIVQLINCDSEEQMANDSDLYAVAYHPVVRGNEEAAVDQWVKALAVGEKLPVLPLFLNAVDCLPIDLETTYSDACRRRRIG